MNKNFIIEFEATDCNDDTLQGDFNEKTVIKEVEEFLKDRYGDRLNWFVIKDSGKIIYDSLKK